MNARHLIASLLVLGCAHATPDPAPPEPGERESPPHGDDVPGVLLPTDPATIAAGAALFERHCTACHAPSTSYRVGPDLTDERWQHGDSPNAVYQVIWFGVKARGMPAWGGLLDEGQVASLTAFVLARDPAQR